MKINQELIKKARQTNLVAFLEENGYYSFKREGRSFRCLQHDSLVITDNAFYWNSKSSSGNAIDFLITHLDIDFKTAVTKLNQTQKSFLQSDYAKNFFVSTQDIDIKRLFAYLYQKRFIDNNIISSFVNKNLIQIVINDKGYPNIGFPIKNENFKIVGYELSGLTDKKFKGITPNIPYGYGFKIMTSKDNPSKVYFFESAIDLISYYELYRPSKALLVSCAGVKLGIVTNTLKTLLNDPEVLIAFDNDIAGNNAYSKIAQTNNQMQFKRLIPPKGKDWNEFLKLTKAG